MGGGRRVAYRYGWAAGALLAIGGFTVPGSAAAHGGNPDPNIVHACVVKASGTVKIVGPNDTCSNGQYPLDWNIQGPPGTPGTPGPPGSPGGLTAPTLVKFSSPDDSTTHRKVAFAKCPEGTRVFGGGGEAFIADEPGAVGTTRVGAVALKKSASNAQGTGWGVTGERQDPNFTGKWWVTAHALCHAVSDAPAVPAAPSTKAQRGASRK